MGLIVTNINQQNKKFKLKADAIPNSSTAYPVKVTATLEDGTVVTATKNVTVKAIPVDKIEVEGNTLITAIASQHFNLSYKPANANIPVQSVQVDLKSEEEGDKRIITPFILYNAGTDNATIKLVDGNNSLTAYNGKYAIVDDYVEGRDYNDNNAEYIAALTLEVTLPPNKALLMKRSITTWTISSANAYVKRFSISGGAIKAYGDISMLHGGSALKGSYMYYNMFNGCTSLIKAPELPATTLAQNCYGGMFRNCSALTQAPELKATTLEPSCYTNMFNGCSKLNYVKMLASYTSAHMCIDGWLSGVASSGTLVRHPNANIPVGASGIPNGWSVEYSDGYVHWLPFTASAGSGSVFCDFDFLLDGKTVTNIISNNPKFTVSELSSTGFRLSCNGITADESCTLTIYFDGGSANSVITAKYL